MYKKLKRISEVFIVMEHNNEDNSESIVFVETTRSAAEEDIKNYCKAGRDNFFYIAIEKIYTEPGAILWLEEPDC